MTFSVLYQSDLLFKPVKAHIINKKGYVSKYVIKDSDREAPYDFKCPCCHTRGSFKLEQTHAFSEKKIRIEKAAMADLGGVGLVSQLIQCDNCQTYFFVGFGYTEPNNGRDVFFIHNIVELKIVDKLRHSASPQSKLHPHQKTG